MGRLLRDASIRTKILVVVMLVTTVSLVVASTLLLAWDSYQFRRDIGRELAAQARLVLENSTAAMSFQDRAAARETLETLAPNPHIQLACLYDETGELFAQLSGKLTAGACPIRPPPAAAWFTPGRAHVVAQTRLAGQPAGSIYLESDLDAVSERARVQAVTAMAVLIVALLVALTLTSVLQRIISEPMYALADTAQAVATSNDYSIRARRDTGDELGDLVDAFNAMLSQIERAEHERAGLVSREREANRLKDEFLMTLSHELRTPLNAIQGWTSMLLAHIIPPDGVDNALFKIERNAQAQAKLIEDLLDVSRFTTGKFRLERVPVDLVAIASQAVESIRPAADAKHITVKPHLDVVSAPMNGDPDRLQQVIWNLLSNAVKFSPSGSVVSLTIRTTGGFCELRVQDSGVGIDPAFLPLVFEPLRQADSSSTRTHSGLGLGLSIVKRIVDLHGGEIVMESPGVGKGATCTVRLPLAPDAAAFLKGQDHVQPSTSRHLAGARMLVVDDDPDTRDILSVAFGAAGATVQQASNAADGLRLAHEFSPDVLISDIAMPELDGYGLLSRLRHQADTTSPRVAIAVTAQATSADRERALAAGFDHHVAKPFDTVELIEIVRRALEAANGTRHH